MTPRTASNINRLKLRALFEAVRLMPGSRPPEIARALGWKPEAVHNALTSLETLGLYLYEHAFVMAPQEVPNS